MRLHDLVSGLIILSGAALPREQTLYCKWISPTTKCWKHSRYCALRRKPSGIGSSFLIKRPRLRATSSGLTWMLVLQTWIWIKRGYCCSEGGAETESHQLDEAK